MIAKLPPEYADLARETGPRLLLAALEDYGLKEFIGRDNNPIILDWAIDLGLKEYTADSIPWCGLGMAHWVSVSGWDVPEKPLWALNWAKFGNKVDVAMLGDVLVFKRKGGGHVGLYVGENGLFYHVLGANQGDAVSIKQIPKKQCVAIRRCPWRHSQPANVRVIKRKTNGAAVISEKGMI